MKYPDSLFAGGRAVHPLKIYAYGSLVLWTCKEINLADTLRTLVETAEKIAIASPQHAPYGSAAVEALKHYKLYEIAAPKLVYGRSISQVNQYILSRAVDWGITAKSTVFSPDISSRGTWIEIDPAAYTPVAQGAVILQHGQENHPEATQAFFDFLFSETARQIFRNHGYQLP
jgi:molybdate transport system substrate-binding protein